MTDSKHESIAKKVEFTPVFHFILSDKELLSCTKQKVMPLIISVVLGRILETCLGKQRFM